MPRRYIFLDPCGFLPTQLIDPQIAQDAKHPRIETSAGLETVCMGKRTLAGCLHQIVRHVSGAAERDGETSQIWQESDQLVCDFGVPINHMCWLRLLFVGPRQGISEREARFSREHVESPVAGAQRFVNEGRTEMSIRLFLGASRNALVASAIAIGFLLGNVTTPWGDVGGTAIAYAQDDDDDGGGGGGGRASGSGEGRPSARPRGGPNLFKLLKRQFRQGRPSRQRSAAKRRPSSVVAPTHQRDEIVAIGLTDQQIAILLGQGFDLRSRHVLPALGGEVAKLDPPSTMSLEVARDSVRRVAPAAAVDYNHFYRPEADRACGGRPCVAPGLVRWPGAQMPAARCDSADIVIGLIDTAINIDHETFASSRLEVLRIDPAARDPSGKQHGTAVASILVGTGAKGTPGLLPGARLIGVDVFVGDDRSDAYDLARAIDMLAARKVIVINMSLSGPDNSVLAKAVQAVAAKNIAMVAAAGNEGPASKPVFPAAYEQVIAVTAVDRQKRPYRRANRGDYIDLAAPGVGVWAAASLEGARPKTGTSFAAPFVTAAVALAKADAASQGGDVHTLLTSQAEDLGDPGKDPVFGWGLLDASRLCRK